MRGGRLESSGRGEGHRRAREDGNRADDRGDTEDEQETPMIIDADDDAREVLILSTRHEPLS